MDAMDHREVRELIDRSHFCQESLREVAALLPESDTELEAMLAGLAEKSEALYLSYCLSAALLAERKVHARILAEGTRSITLMPLLAHCAWGMEGDSSKYLMEAAGDGGMTQDCLTGSVFLALAWRREHPTAWEGATLHEKGKASMEAMFYDQVVSHARQIARGATIFPQSRLYLHAIAELTQDAALIEILGKKAVEKERPETLKEMEEILEAARQPICESLFEKPTRSRVSGSQPLRRSVPKHPPNSPCRCGSGRKYKKCCQTQDRERLRFSSSVAGKTVAEAIASPESDMTATRLEQSLGSDLARIDVQKLAPELRQPFLIRLGDFSLLDELATAFEALGVTAEFEPLWLSSVRRAVRAQRHDVLQRLINAHPKENDILPELPSGARLLFSADYGDSFNETLEEEALAALKTEDAEELHQFAEGVIFSQCAALGIFVARSMLPLVGKEQAGLLLKEILSARDRLGLSPNDPASDLVDERFAERRADDSEDLRAARLSLLRSKNGEQELQAEVRQAQREMAQQKEEAAKEKTPGAPEDSEVQRALREKNDRLKAQLRIVNEERTRDRNRTRELEKERAKQEKARQPEPETEEDCGTEVSFEEIQPVRLVEFSRDFAAAVTELPQKVVRAAMMLIGELSAGEASAFVGVARMHKCHGVLRQKLRRDYRLLFILEGKYLRIVNLVDRKDLELTLIKLRAGALPPAETRAAG